MDDGGGDRVSDAGRLEVWACHVPALSVYGLCILSGIGGMGGVAWLGIEPAAIYSAARLLRLPRADWPDVACDVALMGQAAAAERNRKAAEESARARRK